MDQVLKKGDYVYHDTFSGLKKVTIISAGKLCAIGKNEHGNIYKLLTLTNGNYVREQKKHFNGYMLRTKNDSLDYEYLRQVLILRIKELNMSGFSVKKLEAILSICQSNDIK